MEGDVSAEHGLGASALSDPLDFLTAKDLARLFKVSLWTIRQRTLSGDIPCVKIGPRSIRYSREAIQEMMLGSVAS